MLTSRRFRLSLLRLPLSFCSLLISLLLSACGGGDDEMDSDPEPTQTAAIILPGAISDQGWNQMGYLGLEKIGKETGAEIRFAENVPAANWDRVARSFAEEGVDVLILHGLEFTEIAEKYAPQFPDTHFIVNNSIRPLDDKNLTSIEIRTWEASFLAGILAGQMTESGICGAVGGNDYPLFIAQAEGYRLGARSANPEAKTQIVFTGSNFDTIKAKEAAQAQIESGADIIWQLANSAGLGVIEACREAGVDVFGWGIDQRHVAPEVVITTQKVDVGAACAEVGIQILQGTFEGGSVSFGVESEAAGLGEYREDVPQEYRDVVEKWRQAIADGLIEIPLMKTRDASEGLEPLSLP
ncbi:BMP family protein [Pelagicoccus albus]|uniref:BMP family protein n=1 Tax=Pelagicoccus albus TaxID=415222 RepID=A0A7X1B8Z8_9BACT|nr:BMP family protein [Pelagicoccus albus]MBC2607900.1 BMP family protein [Pelagicoccus albus]